MSACRCEYGASGAHEGGCPAAGHGVIGDPMQRYPSHLIISAQEADELERYLMPQYINRNHWPKLHELLDRLMKSGA